MEAFSEYLRRQPIWWAVMWIWLIAWYLMAGGYFFVVRGKRRLHLPAWILLWPLLLLTDRRRSR